jgi:hypothetical protein
MWHWAERFAVWFGTGSGISGVSCEVLTGYLSVAADLTETGPVCGIGHSVLRSGLVQEVAATPVTATSRVLRRPLLDIYCAYGKSKGYPISGHQGPTGGIEVYIYSFSTSALEGGGWSAPRPGRFTPGKDPVPIVQKSGWAPGPVWTCAKILAPTGIRSPDRPSPVASRYTD